MRYLIDGYNLMHELGLMPRALPPGGLRKVRHRFLNDLADKLGPTDAHLTTVVFDARDAPEHLPSETRHKGLSVEYADDVDEADDRIEQIIARHSAPKTLSVVSSDRRIRQAARRRRALTLSSDEFWTQLDDRKDRARRNAARKPSGPPPEIKPEAESDREHWLRAFGSADEMLSKDGTWDPGRFAPTDEEIARIEREIQEEDDGF